MKAKDVKGIGDFKAYLEQCGAKYRILDDRIVNAEGSLRGRRAWRARIYDKNGGFDMDVQYLGLDATWHICIHDGKGKPQPNTTELETICRKVWAMSRKKKSV